MSSITCFNRICALILFFMSSSLAFPNPINNLYDSHNIETRSTRHYCGTNLVRALHFLCESYNKRSSSNTFINRLSEDVSDQENDLISSEEKTTKDLLKLFQNRNDMKKIEMNHHFHRSIRGVVDECCRRSCSTSQLSQYCGVTRVTTTTAPPTTIE